MLYYPVQTCNFRRHQSQYWFQSSDNQRFEAQNLKNLKSLEKSNKNKFLKIFKTDYAPFYSFEFLQKPLVLTIFQDLKSE